MGIIIHETGHLISGKLVGGVPKRMSIGTGHLLIKMRIWGVKIVAHDHLSSGYAYSAFHKAPPGITGGIFFKLGGILFNVIVAIVALILLPSGIDLQSIYFANNPLLSLIAANGYMALMNLTPYRITLQGVRRDNDGLGVYRILTGKDNLSSYTERSAVLFELTDLMEDGNYYEATSLTEVYLKTNPEDDLIKTNLLVCYLKSGLMSKATDISAQLLAGFESESNDEKAIINSVLAHYLMVKGNIDQAYELSRLAFSQNNQIREIRVTNGSLLVEQGIYEEGAALIEPYIDLNFNNNLNVEGAVYLALAYRQTANKKKARRYQSYIEKNAGSIEPDTKMLYKRHYDSLSGIQTMLDYSEILRNRDREKRQ